MDPADRSTPVAPSTTAYDGFISYSHSADDLLAPRLQAGLQKFAKPWWKRRAVRIFRDESSLAANPHLWSSITEALDDSGWFVLLLSPDAASSEWVGKEIEHWVANRPADRILPVVTDGEFTWVDGDVAGSSVPPALHGVFGEEPRWVDLRFARGEEQLDLQNPDFSAAVADVAATIRGVPKDELASEEVRQHRRTVRTAWAAGVAVTVLAIAAVVTGVFAIGQRNEAQTNAELAEATAVAEAEARLEADANRLLAEASAAEAQENAEAEAEARKEATRNAELAQSRELAASAVNVLGDDPELAILLTLEAIETTPDGIEQPVEVIDALWQAVQEDRLSRVIDEGSTGFMWVGVSGDGSLLAVASEDDAAVRLYSAPDGVLRWEYGEDTTDSFGHPFVSPDGTMVAVSIWDSGAELALRDLGPDEVPARVVILDAADGAKITEVAFPDCPSAMGLGWSPAGSYFVVSHGVESCEREGATNGTWVEVLDGSTFEPVAFIDALDPFAGFPSFDGSENLYIFGLSYEVGLEVHAPPTFTLDRLIDGIRSGGDVSSDGSLAVTFNPSESTNLAVFDTISGDQTDLLRPVPAFPRFPTGIHFFESDNRVAVATEGTDTLIWNPATGDQTLTVKGGGGTNAAIDSNGRWLYTGHTDGTVKVWNLGPGGGLDSVGDLGSHQYINGNAFSVGPRLGSAVAIDLGAFDFQLVFFDTATGALVGQPVGGFGGGALADGRFLVEYGDGLWHAYDPITGAETQVTGCLADFELNPPVCLDTGEPVPDDPIVSADGSEVGVLSEDSFTVYHIDDAAITEQSVDGLSFAFVHTFAADWIFGSVADRSLAAVDRVTGEELARPSVEWGRTEVSATGGLLAAWTESGDSLSIVETATWDARSIPLELGRVRGMSIGPNESRIALGDENGLHIINLATGSIEQSIPLPSVSDIHWIDENTVLIGTTNGVWATIPLKTDDLINSAGQGVTRDFTAEECTTYRIDPCPATDS